MLEILIFIQNGILLIAVIPKILICKDIGRIKTLFKVNNCLVATLEAWHLVTLGWINHFDHDQNFVFVFTAGFVSSVEKFTELFENIGSLTIISALSRSCNCCRKSPSRSPPTRIESVKTSDPAWILNKFAALQMNLDSYVGWGWSDYSGWFWSR